MQRLLLLGLVALCAACAESGPPPRPLSGVLITLDTTNPRALDWYGRRGGITPRMDELAAESVVYEAARSTAPITLVSHASMLTGLYPPRHGVRDNGVRPLPEAAETLAERARERGWQTAAFVAAIVLSKPYGTAQGFDVYDEPGGDGSREVERTGDRVTAAAIAWLRARDPERPFFLWAHYFDPHAPYVPAAQFREQVGRRGRVPEYLGEVAQMDAAVGELLDELRAIDPGLDDTVLCIVGDHGEALGRHGEQDHGLLAYDATMRVPLLLRRPDGARAGERSSEMVSVADVYPTFVEALGLGTPGRVDGVSLWSEPVPPGRGVYFETYSGHLSFGWSPLTGWADARGTYLHGPDPALYLPGDEEQSTDASAEHPELVQAARAAIAEVASRPPLSASAAHLDGETRDRIRSLGYAGGGDPDAPLPHPLEVEGLPDPEQHLDEHLEFMRAAMLDGTGRRDEAIDVLARLAGEHPTNALAIELWGVLLYRQGRDAAAIEVLRRLETQGRERRAAMDHLVRALERAGRPEEALEVAIRSAERWPDDPAVQAELERLLDVVGD